MYPAIYKFPSQQNSNHAVLRLDRYLGKLNGNLQRNLIYVSYSRPVAIAYQSAEENTGTGKKGNGAAEA